MKQDLEIVTQALSVSKSKSTKTDSMNSFLQRSGARAALVSMLVDCGADVNARDFQWQHTMPLCRPKDVCCSAMARRGL